MNQATTKVIEAIANDILTLAHLILETDKVSVNKKVNKNTLKDSALNENVATSVSEFGGGSEYVIKAIFSNYINFLEWDRPEKHGDKPPIDALRDWALDRGIPTDNATLWAISTAIWRDGHEGRPIIAVLEKEIVESFDKEFYKELFDAIIDELIKFFN